MWNVWRRGPAERVISIHKPLLESWNHKDDPDQIRLRAYLDRIQSLLTDYLSQKAKDPLFLHLDVARDLSDPQQLLKHHDVENYVTPIVYRLGARRFKFISVTKRLGKVSFLEIGRAEPDNSFPAERPWRHLTFPPSTAPGVKDWKAGLKSALAKCAEEALSATGPVAVEMVWRCSPARNWIWLWKPTGDAMGPILGEPFPNRPYYPNDDRIVSLALRWISDAMAGYGVQAGLWWREANSDDTPATDLLNDPGAADIDTDSITAPPRQRKAKPASQGFVSIGTEPQPIGGRQPGVVETDVELRTLRKKGRGWIYNDYAGKGSTGSLYNILHQASCPWLGRSKANIPKYFFDDLNYAQTWLEENRGKEDMTWKRCPGCAATH